MYQKMIAWTRTTSFFLSATNNFISSSQFLQCTSVSHLLLLLCFLVAIPLIYLGTIGEETCHRMDVWESFTTFKICDTCQKKLASRYHHLNPFSLNLLPPSPEVPVTLTMCQHLFPPLINIWQKLVKHSKMQHTHSYHWQHLKSKQVNICKFSLFCPKAGQWRRFRRNLVWQNTAQMSKKDLSAQKLVIH